MSSVIDSYVVDEQVGIDIHCHGDWRLTSGLFDGILKVCQSVTTKCWLLSVGLSPLIGVPSSFPCSSSSPFIVHYCNAAGPGSPAPGPRAPIPKEPLGGVGRRSANGEKRGFGSSNRSGWGMERRGDLPLWSLRRRLNGPLSARDWLSPSDPGLWP